MRPAFMHRAFVPGFSRSPLPWAAIVFVVLMSACASSGGGGGNDDPLAAAGGGGGGPASGGVRQRTGSREVIRADEVAQRASDAGNAYDIIAKLRPQMLVGRGTASPTDRTGETARPKIYVDNVQYGDLGSLRNIAANQVLEIRFVSASDATTRWGTGHMGGVIMVTTKRR